MEIISKLHKKYFRPIVIETLLGNSTKAKNILGWKPTITFDELVKDMVKCDTNT